MAEASSTDKNEKTGKTAKTPTATAKKPAQGKATKATPPAPQSGWAADWRVWGLVGGLLVFGVIAWKLLGTSYKGDVRTICEGETASGFTLDKDMSKVTTYVRQHLGTPEGNELFSTLSDARLAERAKRLQSEANSVGLHSCPMVAAFEKVAAEGEYRADLQHMCSNVAFPHFGELDDAARLQRLEDWIDQGAKSPRTKELAEPLRQGTPADRAKLLRQTAEKVDVFHCDLATTLEGPILPSKGKGPPVVRPFGEPQIVGPLKPAEVARALAEATPAMNECYKKGLERKPDLEGKLAIAMKVDPDGKVANLAPADQTLPDKQTAACVIQVLKGMEFPKNPGPLVSVFLPLELTTAGVAGASAAPAGSTGQLPLVVPPSLARPVSSSTSPAPASSKGH